MATTQNIPARTYSRLWRVLFWVTLIHFVIVGFMTFAAFSEFGAVESIRASDLKELGLLNAASLWLFFHTAFVESALAAGDIAALFLAWRSAHRVPCPRRMVIAYLMLTLGLAAVHAAGAANAGLIGWIRTSTLNTEIPMEVVWPLVIWDAIFVLPPLLILARLIFSGWPTRGPGLCVSCGYDLTGNTSGVCPECGTPATEHQHAMIDDESRKR